MGHIFAKNLEYIDIIKPTKKTKIIAAVMSDDVLFLRTSTDKLILARLAGSYHKNYCYIANGRMNYIAKGMMKLGLIDEKTYNEYVAKVKKWDAERELKDEIESLFKKAKKLGYEVKKI